MSGFDRIGRFLPRGIIREVSRFLDMAGMVGEAEGALGTIAFLSVAFGLILFLISVFATDYLLLFSQPFAGAGEIAADIVGGLIMFIVIEIVAVIAVSMIFYAYLIVQIDARKRELEAVLPDFLQLSAANVRAGLPIEQALWRAATPEFGILSKEVQNAMKRTFSGESIADSLTYLSGRFNSKYLQRTASVLKFGIASGGEIGEILERTASDLRKMQIMYKEASSSMVMYVIFITFAALIGAPFLFAVSYKLIATLGAVWAHIPTGQNFQSFGLISFSPPQISAEDFKVFIVVATIITSLFASFILAVIRSGSARDGLTLLPFFLIAGLGFLFLFISIVNSLLSNLFI